VLPGVTTTGSGNTIPLLYSFWSAANAVITPNAIAAPPTAARNTARVFVMRGPELERTPKLSNRVVANATRKNFAAVPGGGILGGRPPLSHRRPRVVRQSSWFSRVRRGRHGSRVAPLGLRVGRTARRVHRRGQSRNDTAPQLPRCETRERGRG